MKTHDTDIRFVAMISRILLIADEIQVEIEIGLRFFLSELKSFSTGNTVSFFIRFDRFEIFRILNRE